MSEFATTSHGDTVAYDLRGTGPAVIFVAGAGPYRAVDPITTATAATAAGLGIATINYDRLGRGESVATGELTLDRELAAIAALIDVAGGSAVLCGHSSGCSISLAAAASGLEVAGLALWEPPIQTESGAREWSDEFSRLVRDGELERAQALYMKDMPPEWLEGARQSPAWPTIYGAAWTLQPDAESLAWTESDALPNLLANIRVPVEVMMGEQQTEPIFPVAAAAIIAALPAASQKRMPGAHHTWEVEPMARELAAFATSALAG